jgi:hypothetical protein
MQSKTIMQRTNLRVREMIVTMGLDTNNKEQYLHLGYQKEKHLEQCQDFY